MYMRYNIHTSSYFLVATSHNLTVRSSLPVPIILIPGLNLPQFTQLLWPYKEYWNLRSLDLHTLAHLSSPVLKINLSFGEYSTHLTGAECAFTL